jgi:ribosomal protein S18 acetylase RimI-like enzyme
MTELLDHSSENEANQIYDLFQLSYKVEAALVGVEDFPPLSRSTSEIRSSKSQFLGLRIDTVLAAVVEYDHRGDDLSIDSLVVHPEYFRRGLASRLLQSLLDSVEWKVAYVETAAANSPAIVLYQKFGFAETEQWRTADGIDKVSLMRATSL